MTTLTVDADARYTRWVLLAGLLASALATFVLVSRFGHDARPAPDGWDEIYGM